MRYRCHTCGQSCTNDLPSDTVVRACITCPECIEANRVVFYEKWSRERPTEPGWYWYIEHRYYDTPSICQVNDGRMRSACDAEWHPLEEFSEDAYLWLKLLDPPTMEWT